MDVTENDDWYALTVELPGTKKEDVTVEVHESVLTIRGEKRNEREEEKEQRRYIERALTECEGNVSRAARICGLTRAALQRIMKSLKLDRTSFVP